jgi:hypothetical protein
MSFGTQATKNMCCFSMNCCIVSLMFLKNFAIASSYLISEFMLDAKILELGQIGSVLLKHLVDHLLDLRQ